MSRWLPLVFFLAVLYFAAHAAELPAACPLWDGKETVEHYAKRASLPPTKTLDLCGGVKLELVLIPAGKYIMGTDDSKDLLFGFLVLAAAVVILLAMTGWDTARGI